MLLNDTFDTLNARCPKEAITKTAWEESVNNKPPRKQYLLKMLEMINKTEQHFDSLPRRKRGTKMFASRQTISGWKITVRSAISLTEECFKKNYKCVYSAKWNQDPIEVIFECLECY